MGGGCCRNEAVDGEVKRRGLLGTVEEVLKGETGQKGLCKREGADNGAGGMNGKVRVWWCYR